MKKRLLLTTDFSQNSKNAMMYAIQLFEHQPCDFYILNTYTIEPFTMEMTTLRNMDESQRGSVSRLSAILSELKESRGSSEHDFHIISEYGALVDIIKLMVDKYDMDMVVMGTKGDTDSRTEIYGSQTVLAIESVRTCPIMAVPKNASFNGLKTIVFPTGYRTAYKRKEFQYLIDIVRDTNAGLRIFHVNKTSKRLDEEQRCQQQRLKEYFEGLDYSFHSVLSKDILSSIDKFIEQEDSNMVVFINKKHSFLRWMLSKPMVKHLTYHSNVPILALHDLSNL